MVFLKEARNLHTRLQEMCDCYMDTDYGKELKKMASGIGEDLEEEALKYLALSILFTITNSGKKLSIKRKKRKQKVTVKAQEKMALPSPTPEITEKIFEIMRSITHLEGERGKEPFSLGLRDSRVELEITLKKKDDEESLKFSFPKS